MEKIYRYIVKSMIVLGCVSGILLVAEGVVLPVYAEKAIVIEKMKESYKRPKEIEPKTHYRYYLGYRILSEEDLANIEEAKRLYGKDVFGVKEQRTYNAEMSELVDEYHIIIPYNEKYSDIGGNPIIDDDLYEYKENFSKKSVSESHYNKIGICEIVEVDLYGKNDPVVVEAGNKDSYKPKSHDLISIIFVALTIVGAVGVMKKKTKRIKC